jgi:hypothetical protein
MAGTLNVDTLKADSNLKLQIASANVAFIDANGLTIVGNSLNVGGGRIVVTSNNSISTSNVVGANILTTTGTTALGITANGQITTANAPFILTGGQIKFPATQISSLDANTLDDYEEGYFTATMTPGTSGTITLNASIQNLSYTKIGRVVTITGLLRPSSVSSPVGTFVTIGTLPFASANYDGNLLYGARAGGSCAFDTNPKALTQSENDNTFRVYLTASGITSSTDFFISYSYITS